MKRLLKKLLIRYDITHWIYITFFLLFYDRKSYIRGQFSKYLKRLSLLIVKNEMMGGCLTERGDFYIKTHDDIFLYYNYSNIQYTFGDGQSCDFQSAHKVGRVEKFIMNYLKNGMVYFDVGANNGYYYSLKVAKKNNGCGIYAFEPDNKILYHLKKNIKYNNLKNIKVILQALTDFVGKTKITANMGASGFLVVDDSVSVDTVEIQCSTLDNFVRENDIGRIDLIKLDIEGGEYNFLKGAFYSLNKFIPIIVLELDEKLLNRSKASVDLVISLLRNLDYKVFRIINSRDALAIPAKKIYILSDDIKKCLLEMKSNEI